MTKNKISPAKEQLYNILITKVYNSPHLPINDDKEGFIPQNIKHFVVDYVNEYAKKHRISETEAIIMCSSTKEIDNIASELDSLRLEFYLDFYDDDFDDDYMGEFWFDYEDIM